MKTSDLIEQRGAIVDRMTAAHDKDDNAAFTAAETELRSLDDKIDRARKIEAAERTETGRVLTGDKGFAELRNQSLIETIRYKMDPTTVSNETRAKIEREQAMLAERAGKPANGVFIATEVFEKRDVQLTTNSGAIVANDFRPELFVSALTATAALTQLGATTLTGLSGNVEIPRETGSPNVAWVGENQAIPTDNATFDSVGLTPHHVGSITEISRNMIMQSSPNIEQLLRSMMARDIALEIDRAGLNGSGTGAEPLGVLNDPGIQTAAWNTDLFTTTADMIAKADLANVTGTGFLGTNGIKADAMKVRDTTNRPIPISDTFHGERALFTNQAPSDLGDGNDHGLVYGNWSDLLIGIWSQLDILVNPYAEGAYSKGNMLIRAMATVDFAVRRPASFVKTLVAKA